MGTSFLIIFSAGFGVQALLRAPSLEMKPPEPAAAFWVTKNGEGARGGAASFATNVKVSPENVLWTFSESDGHGAIESTPLIDENRTTYIVTTSGGIYAIAYGGAILWSKRETGRCMTPFLESGLLYVGIAESPARVCKFVAATGEKVWCVQYADTAGGDAWTTTVAGDVVIVPADDNKNCGGNRRVVALNKADGSKAWEFEPKHWFWNLMPSIQGDAIYFSDSTGTLYLLGIADGKLRWSAPPTNPGSLCTGGNALGPNGVLYASSNREGMRKGLIRAIDTHTNKELWRHGFEIEAAAAPAVGFVGAQERLVVFEGTGNNPGITYPKLHNHSGAFVCLDATTGEQLWDFSPPPYENWAAAGVRLDRESLPDTWSNPAVDANGNVYVGWSGGTLYHLDGATGTVLSQHHIGNSFQGEPALAPGLVVASSIYKVVAYGNAS